MTPTPAAFVATALQAVALDDTAEQVHAAALRAWLDGVWLRFTPAERAEVQRLLDEASDAAGSV
jgi:FMN phosphatase YigB (HAD superfamily)